MAGTERLESAPGMGLAFARALLPGTRGEGRIPDRTVVVAPQRQDRERLAEYARVCSFTLRDHVPPTWIHVLTFPLHVHLLGDPGSSIRLVGAVHVSNIMTLRRPVDAAEPLTLAVRVENLRPHTKGALIDLVGEARVGDELVWDGISTYLSPGAHTPGEPVPVPRAQFEEGVPHALWRLPQDLGRQYRRVSRDPNLIHTSRIAARALGFERPIIHGMWTHARALAALEGRLPPAYTVGASFVKPILLPATVGFRATPTAGGHDAVGHDAVVTNREGTKPHLILSVRRAS